MTSAPLLLSLPALPLSAMEKAGQALARCLAPGDTVTLTGELGAGKTAFARALIGAIAVGAPEVTSPTFTLMQSYDVQAAGEECLLWHLDLYRLEDAKELEALGLEELWPHIVLIEWPEIAAGMLPQARLEIVFAFGPADTRTLAFHGNDAWRKRLGALV